MTKTDANRSLSTVPFSANTVDLLETSINWAIEMSRTVLEQEAQWQAFLRSLAVAGFEQWLDEGGSAFTTHLPADVPALNAEANFRANNYRLCILTAPGSATETVEIAVSSSNLAPSHLAHLYVLVEVREEIDQVCILAGLQRERLLQNFSQQAIADATSVEVSPSLFDIEPEQMLLYINCLEPEAALNLATQASSEVQSRPIETISTGVINASRWIQGQLDEVATRLSWVLLPPAGFASELRPAKNSLEAVTEALANKGVQLPAAARGVSGPVTVGWFTGRLYAWAWPIEQNNALEWGLFLLLGSQEEAVLPEGMQLWVGDDAGMIVQETLEHSTATYLYTQVQGARSERFWVRIVLPDGRENRLPAFCFEQNFD